MKRTLIAAACLASFSAYGQSYIGLEVGKADHSKFSVNDMEWDSLSITKNDNHPTGWGLYVGHGINDYLSAELGYLNLGKKKVAGTDSGAVADGSIGIDGLALSLLVGKSFGPIKPYARLGLMYERRQRDVTPSGNAAAVFANPNPDHSETSAVRPLYGVGVEAELSRSVSLRADYSVVKDAYVDYINNIDAGYIKRNVTLASLGLLYKFDSTPNGTALGDGKWSMGLAGGWSRTSARLTGGHYDGNIWDLRTNTVNSQVNGDMSDDKTGTTYRLSLFRDEGPYEFEVYLATLGEYRSRSAANGIVGGGNILTGAATRTANALGADVGYKLEPQPSLSIIPKVGLAAVKTRDEIYNNLDFAGVGGSARGPIVNQTVLSPTLGLTVGYQLTKSIEARLGYEHYFRSGTDSALGKGAIATLSAGVKIGL